MPSYRHFAERDDNGVTSWSFDFTYTEVRSFFFSLRFPPLLVKTQSAEHARRVSTVVKLSYCPVGRFTGAGEPTLFVSRTAPLQKRFDPLVVLWLARTQITRRYSIAAERACTYTRTHIFFSTARLPQMRTGVFSYFQLLVRVKFYSLPKQPAWRMNSCAVCIRLH